MRVNRVFFGILAVVSEVILCAFSPACCAQESAAEADSKPLAVAAMALSQSQSEQGKPVIEVEVYSVDVILNRLAGEAGLSEEAAIDWLHRRIRHFLQLVKTSNAVFESELSVRFSETESVPMNLDSNGCGLLFHQRSMVVAAPLAAQQSIAQRLATLAQFGMRQIVIRTAVYRGPSEEMSELPIRWTHTENSSEIAAPTSAAQNERATPALVPGVVQASYVGSRTMDPAADLGPPAGVTTATWTHARSIVERSTPILYTLLAPAEKDALTETLHDSDFVERVMSPQVVVFNGQCATVSDSIERPFVTGIKPVRLGDAEQQQIEFAPSIRVYPEGTTMKMLPDIIDGQQVRLNYQLKLCNIRQVNTLDLPRFDGAGRFTVQLPEVATTEFQTCLNIPIDHSLAVTAYDLDDDGNQRAVLVICQCSIRDMESNEVTR